MNISISTPTDTKCILKVGQKVDFNTPFIEDYQSEDIIISIAKKLQIPSDKIFKYLKKFVGDPIQKGDIIAERKSLISKNVILSDYNGVIKEINHYEGTVNISIYKSKNTFTNAYFKGEIVELTKERIKIKVTEAKDFQLKQASTNFGGETIFFKDPYGPIFASQAANKIMIAEVVDVYLKTKAEALGIRGFVTMRVPPQNSDLPEAQIKTIEDFKQILKLNLPYCLIDKQYSKIYFYR
ncbi:hypothetical protein A3C98_01375 [Candidatus Roizmanbacteria bacterium RIFCSPHIGHO2_02_FULL_37_15]|uniref:Uncharacterized protein n=1 Tax=Candidatus Roizmanbacteria bacterium RIFCSPLOWO2_01_FULL_37_16 TaxID=1802058 RepID=A0A1F7IQG4_9BACT|nr:MAG: hypothetical protein A2859_03190 [Candidatus Roizmanbacteria bacterium RIFCSPHIGHO2_01_FULL_37_16b]OGK21125.1 MAG: hypothetical protein A3C98_01375 [Candidatus Roizmanbacteria bacterium RIFCSPHIGHO2_02_FULL_37_15]OGK31483.1 MAG: hypothetical protein A3F57_06180 [Candidatus Roizmanbacteria bacterium RIFCSPHIGHO2_12_FULL_36_11]OGK45603.1 MAG: hypothetical protein A3B40_00215 [Candidatus Roizmanbacteria bacterium RIFCSPLOWO2_01_FULL_37_16]OGK56000.1 MAG: hypothetical protein A3I50_02905 [C